MLNRRMLQRMKHAALLVTAIAAGTASSCGFSLKDVRYNIINGTMDFVESYTTELWTAILPAWEDLLNPTEE